MSRHRYAGVLLVLSLIAAGCSQGAEPTDAGAQASRGNQDQSALKQMLDGYLAVPQFTPAGEKFDLSTVKGKTIFNIPDSSANPFAAGVAEAQERAAKALGINFINCNNQGQVTEWVSCYNQAIQRKVDVINNFGGADPRQLGPQINAAQAAGIKVVATAAYGSTQQPVTMKYSVPAPFEKAGELMAAWVALDTRQAADVLVITSNEVVATQPIVDNFKRTFAKECPDCKATYVNVPVKDWATKIQSEVQSAMVRNPKLNYVVPIYDSMSQFVVPAVTAAGKTGKVFVATFNGTPFVLKYLQDGDIVRMVVGESLEYLGYAFVDADARLLAGENLHAVFDAKIPVRIFTKDNVDEAGTPPEISTGYGESIAANFHKMWGLS